MCYFPYLQTIPMLVVIRGPSIKEERLLVVGRSSETECRGGILRSFLTFSVIFVQTLIHVGLAQDGQIFCPIFQFRYGLNFQGVVFHLFQSKETVRESKVERKYLNRKYRR